MSSGRAHGEEHATRTAILAAALEIVRDEGHHALTVRHVAAQAGCSTIGVYTWFGGKDGLVDAILLDGFERFARALRAARPTRSPLGILAGQARAYRRWALAHPTSYQVMFMQAVPGHVPSDEAAAAGSIAFGLLRDAVVAAQGKGLINGTDTDAVAMAVWGLVHGLVSIEIAGAAPHEVSRHRSLHDRSFDRALSALERGLHTGWTADGTCPRV